MSDSSQERTESATEKRRKEAREKGQVAKSREVTSVIVLLVSLLTFYYGGIMIVGMIQNIMRGSFREIANIDFSAGNINLTVRLAIYNFFRVMTPLFLFLLLASFVANVSQTGFILTSHPLSPNLNKLNPLKGFKNIFFSMRSIGEVVKGILKILIISYVVYFVISKEFSSLPSLSGLTPHQIFIYIAGVSGQILFRVSLALILLAILDFAFEKYRFEESIKMSKQEVKEETKQAEGNPHTKNRIRTVQRQMARRRMMAQVPKADVIITNPTHLAIALEYKEGMEAPRVLAKGERLVAERIKALAKEHNIPIVEDKPLARALYGEVEIGDIVPPSFYRAIAEVLAYVMKVGKLKSRNWDTQNNPS